MSTSAKGVSQCGRYFHMHCIFVMNSLIILALTVFLSCANGQFEGGFVKILEDQRYQDGAAFGNFRNQEDGIKYKEETNPQGIRTGFWEYPDETGQIKRVEFEAGAGIGFRIINSNIVAPTPVHKRTPSPQLSQPIPKQREQTQIQPIVQSQPKPQIHQPQHIHVPLQRQQQQQPQVKPEPINLFDYPADLQFFRDNAGHRFKFTAV